MEQNQESLNQNSNDKKQWYDKWYKLMLVIPVLILLISVAYIGFFYYKNHDFIYKDTSLSGGTTITLTTNLDQSIIEQGLKSKFPDVSIRKLSDLSTGESTSVIIETSASPDEIQPEIEKVIGTKLTEDNSTIEFTGPNLSKSFYQDLIIALIISFVLMSITVFIIFRTFTPSIAVIFAVLADIIIPLAVIDFIGMRISAAGIAAFLMLIGYSVDTDILLTTRVLRTKGGTVNSRIFRAFKTGIFMTIAALVAVIPAFIFGGGLPESFRQIFFILALGLGTDIMNTWLTNASIIKWYCVRRKIE